MAGSIPASLKAADITRFVQRAGQVEKAKPVVAYWCYFWAVNQIVPKGLHNTDEESLAYTTNLMDKLEQIKTDNPGNDAIMDDLAGQAYIEQFGLETFQRAGNVVRAGKASRQTADTFLASATFLDLLHIWGPLDPEIASKVKFAKYHALRIAKAIKAGEDPNLSNPTPEPSPGQEFPSDNPNDLHKPSLDRPPGSDTRPRGYSQPTVEEVPDDHDNIQHRLAQRSSLDESLHPSRASSVPPPTFQPSPTAAERPANKHTNGEDYYKTAATGDDVSPIDSAYTDRQASEGGGYFPRVPTFASDLDEPEQPAAPPEDLSFSPTRTMPDSLAFPPTSPTTPRTGQQPMDTFRPFPTPSVHHSGVYNQPQSDQPTSQPQQPSFTSEPPNPEIHGGYGRNYSSVQPTVLHSPPPTQVTESGTAVVDEEAILKAQKHARWAISALNFEDVNTAIKELRGALESLGAF